MVAWTNSEQRCEGVAKKIKKIELKYWNIGIYLNEDPEGGAAPCTFQFMYKVSLHVQFFLSFEEGGQRKGGGYGPEPDNLEDAVA